MSPSILAHLFKPAKIDIGAFIVRRYAWKVHLLKRKLLIFVWSAKGVAWGGVAITALCFLLRIFIRLRTLRRLLLDDYLILLAWLMLLANAAIWQVEKDDLYDSIAVLSGDLSQPLENFIHETQNSLRAIAAVVILFYSSLWCIKFSFLLFFRPLGDKVERQRLLWWTVFVITAASYFACIGTVEYTCLTSSFSYLECQYFIISSSRVDWSLTAQCATRSAINRQRLSLHYNTAMDVITDALSSQNACCRKRPYWHANIVILVPVNLLWKVQMSLRRKLALASLFSMTILIMVFAIVRVIVVSSYSHQPDQTWLFIWDSIEQTVGRCRSSTTKPWLFLLGSLKLIGSFPKKRYWWPASSHSVPSSCAPLHVIDFPRSKTKWRPQKRFCQLRKASMQNTIQRWSLYPTFWHL